MDDIQLRNEAGNLGPLTLTMEIVSAYVASNRVPAAELPSLIAATRAGPR